MASSTWRQLLFITFGAIVLAGCGDDDGGPITETPPQIAPAPDTPTDSEPPQTAPDSGSPPDSEPTPDPTPPQTPPTDEPRPDPSLPPPTAPETPREPEPSPPPPTGEPEPTPEPTPEPPQPPPAPEHACLQIEQAFSSLSVQQPLALLQAPGDAQRWYIMERAGRVLRASTSSAAAREAETFIDISNQVDTSGEGGLLGMAFHPDYPRNRSVFLSYTTSVDAGDVRGFRSVVSRFTASDNGNSLLADSEWPLITLPQPYSNHNGGQITFGPDGYLYFGLGDGGSAGDPKNHGQDTRTLLGAMLRLDVNVSESDIAAGQRYLIPNGQPFPGPPVCRNGVCPDMEQNKCAAPGCPEIFAWGLRNPWRWSFDRATGALWVPDVGQNAREEINIVEAGVNLGWSCLEANAAYKPERCSRDTQLTAPVAEISHPIASSASITGGYVYRGQAIPSLRGTYVFADFVSGEISVLRDPYGAGRIQRVLQTGKSLASFAEDAAGELYVLSLFNPSAIYRLVAGATDQGENCIGP